MHSDMLTHWHERGCEKNISDMYHAPLPSTKIVTWYQTYFEKCSHQSLGHRNLKVTVPSIKTPDPYHFMLYLKAQLYKGFDLGFFYI
jgi:hypothetical protein